MKKFLLSAFALLSVGATAQSWTDQATELPESFYPKDISIVDANTVWTSVGDGSGSGTYPKTVLKTSNGGTTWTPTAVSGLPSNALISDIHGVDANTAFIVTAPNSGSGTANGIWKTTDGGSNWTKQTAFGSTSNSFANQIYFWDANNGWAAGDPVGGKFEMYKTSDGGTTWTAVAGAPVPNGGQGGEFSYVGLKEVVGDNVWIGTDIGRILHSADRGATWTGNFSPVVDFGGVTTEGSSGSFTFKDENNGLLLAVDGEISGGVLQPPTSVGLYSTSDGGANWDILDPVGEWYFGDIAYVPGTANTYVSTGTNYTDDGLYTGSSYSKDGGLTWTAIDAGTQRGSVEFLNPTTGWAGQFSDGPGGIGGIVKFDGDLSLGVADTGVKSSLKVYPNPAADVVNLSSNKEILSVSVLDMSGKKVQTFKGAKEINVSSLAKGTYILQVYYATGSVENTKLIKK